MEMGEKCYYAAAEGGLSYNLWDLVDAKWKRTVNSGRSRAIAIGNSVIRTDGYANEVRVDRVCSRPQSEGEGSEPSSTLLSAGIAFNRRIMSRSSAQRGRLQSRIDSGKSEAGRRRMRGTGEML